MTQVALTRIGTRPARGTPLNDATTEAITRTALDELGRQGFGRFSMETVARRAGVGKAALYRRWPSKEAMIVWLLGQAGLEYAQASDTGSLVGDLHAYFADSVKILRNPTTARIIAHLYAEMSTHSDLAKLIRATIQPQKQIYAEQLIDTAVGRGELPGDLDRGLAMDLLGGPLYWRLIVMDEPADEAYVARLAQTVMAGLQALAKLT